ncbi:MULTISPECIES: nuclease-related domain-containing protein [Bacillaceae]|uniref:NERD domain-containing protein n=1 Tax=Evansella alkalicola TaxID=745819 RepID=A0ABS6JRA3_9BACI|nr:MULTISPECIES: NERD domain-containing protein [Bacillaceae]MBU9721070.1 NERD domain-containing protein [Bacillus alkalicola]
MERDWPLVEMGEMYIAQLVKLSDYISRYEMDIYKYPSRYVRLKKERWQRLVHSWELNKQGKRRFFSSKPEEEVVKKSWRNFWPFKQKESQLETQTEEEDLFLNNQLPISPSLDHLKASFREELFSFQMNWASSTISEISNVKRKYQYDQLLFTLLMELPDTFFVFYEPVFVHKKTSIDLDIMILTPSELWLVRALPGNEQTIYQPGADRFWTCSKGDKKEKILHPIISLKRMRTVIEPLLTEMDLSIPIKTVILAKDAYIDNSSSQRITLIDKRSYREWKEKLSRNVAPLKLHQMKIADAILSNCLTIARERTDFLQAEDEIIEKDK